MTCASANLFVVTFKALGRSHLRLSRVQHPLEALFELNSWILHARIGSMMATWITDVRSVSAAVSRSITDRRGLPPERESPPAPRELSRAASCRTASGRRVTGPWSQPIFRGYEATLPTSLTHIGCCSTRGIKPWRPDEDCGTDSVPGAPTHPSRQAPLSSHASRALRGVSP